MKARTPRVENSLIFRVAEAVADSGLRDQILRARWIRFELRADVSDVDAEVMGLTAVFGPPHLLQQLPVGHEAPLVLSEHADELELDRGEVNVGSCPRDLAIEEVDDHLTELEARLAAGLGRAPEHCP